MNCKCGMGDHHSVDCYLDRTPCGHPAQCDPAFGDPNPGATHGCEWCEQTEMFAVEIAALEARLAKAADLIEMARNPETVSEREFRAALAEWPEDLRVREFPLSTRSDSRAAPA